MPKHNPKRDARKIRSACNDLRSKGIADKDLPDVCKSGSLSGNQSEARSWLTTKTARLPRWFWVIVLPLMLIIATPVLYYVIVGSVFGGQQVETSEYFEFEAYDQYGGADISTRINVTLYAVPINSTAEYGLANYNNSILIETTTVSEAKFNVAEILEDYVLDSDLTVFWVKFNSSDDKYWETWMRPWKGIVYAYLIEKATYASMIAYDAELQILPQTDETSYTVRISCLDSGKDFNKTLGYGYDYLFDRDGYRQLILKVDFDTAPDVNWAEIETYGCTFRVVGNSLLIGFDAELVGSASYTLTLSDTAKSHVTGIDLGYGILTDTFSSILPP